MIHQKYLEQNNVGGYMKIYDLSYKITDNMPVFPGDNPLSIIQNRTLEKDYYNSIILKTNMHVGTHVDIPRHLLDVNTTVDEICIEKFIGNGILLDARGKSIIPYDDKYDKLINKGDIVLIYTDFSNLYTQTEKYYTDYPVIDDSLADFLIYKEIKMVGLDTPSPDKPPFNIHKKLLHKNILILENITNLKALLNVQKFTVYAVPLKVVAEASLVRCYAIENKEIC